VPDDRRDEFPRVHANREFVSKRLSRWLRERPEWLRKINALFCDLLGMERNKPLLWARKLLTQKRCRPQLRPDFEKELRSTFRQDVGKLQDLLGRDLSVWLGGSPGDEGEMRRSTNRDG